MSFAFHKHPLSSGAYTLPDAAHILGLPLSRLRTWVSGIPREEDRHHPVGAFACRSQGRDRHVDFYTLIELFTVHQLREEGLSMKTLRQGREELRQRFNTPYPFAMHGLLTDGRRLIKELGEAALLELGTGGQSAFESVVAPFCRKVDFDAATNLAMSYFPMGREVPVVVSPAHAFGRPVIAGTNLPTETIANLIRGGERVDDIAAEYQITPEEVDFARKFEERLAA